ncbi:hypothetical protein CISIN_1g009897mg [Citrus sinensis]|uniref:Flavin-containing monooxygenase n=1 Tax=Citrus sinensis TaxID=2711 RepID=A0A067HB71_CITSI|nr:hypothetical protein CISIN_1g009897mg [Citrus sinensis]
MGKGEGCQITLDQQLSLSCFTVFSSGPKMERKIAIIGAGVSGLLACKYTLENGFKPIVFEARSGIGGVWSQTIESTKLQTPKSFYQFSDFAWPNSVTETFPDHNKVMEYLQAYAAHFNLFPSIKFDTKVTSIDRLVPSDEDEHSWDLWGGTGKPFSSSGKWNVTVQEARNVSSATEAYQVDFVILCIGRYSDLPNTPDFPMNKGPEVFDGKVLHSMNDDLAAELINGKRVTVIGFQKSAVDVAAEVANRNGVRYPCTLLFKTVHWMVPDYFLWSTFRSLNRWTELIIHNPGEGFFSWLLALSLSPLLWLSSKVVESCLKWTFPLKKYNMIPGHSFLNQISSCMFTVLPRNFYDRVQGGGLSLMKSRSFTFCKNGLVIDGETTPLVTDIVIFATGYKSDEKLKNIFKSTYFQKQITGSSAPLYREGIHPQIPQLAILGYADSPSILRTTEMRSKCLAHFLAGNSNLPTIKEMEHNVMNWEKSMRLYAGESYRRSCVSVLLQKYSNDQLCKDMGCNSKKEKMVFG